MDISDKALELARQKGLDVEKADFTADDFAVSGKFDYIISSENLEHLTNPETLLTKLRGKFNKCIIITIPNTGFIADRLRLLFGRFPKQWVFVPSEHLRFWTVPDFIFWCKQLGYTVEKYYGLRDEEYDIKLKIWQYWPKLFSRYILYKITEAPSK